MKKKFVSIMSVLWTLLLLAVSISAQIEQPTPQPNTYVHDFAHVISDDKKSEIQAKAQRLKDEFKTEIAVVTIDSLQGEDSFDYSMRMARSWGIGSKDNDTRGLLILVAVKDRKTAFRTSRHIEGEITDGATGEISRQMNSYFKQNDFGGGLSFGMDKVLERLQATYQPQSVAAKKFEPNPVLFWFFIILIVLVPCLLITGCVFIVFRIFRRKERTKKIFSPGKYRRPSYNSGSSDYNSPSSNYNSGSSDYSLSSSSYDSGSSSGDSSGASYSGGSDYGGGGSDSSW